ADGHRAGHHHAAVLRLQRAVSGGAHARLAPGMPLFFGSNALYPVALMPGWLQAVSTANPLSYQVDALRGLLLGTPHHLALDYLVLVLAAAAGIAAASSLLGRLAR
ncbi:ABC transporter permease, partial [Streptomyces sp. MCAF7]